MLIFMLMHASLVKTGLKSYLDRSFSPVKGYDEHRSLPFCISPPFISALPITRYSLGSRFTELPFSVILILELASVSRAEFCSCLSPEGRVVLDMRMLISRLDQRFFVFQCTFNLERFLLECRKIVIFYKIYLKNWRQFSVQ